MSIWLGLKYAVTIVPFAGTLPFLELSPPIDAGTAPENKFEAGTLIQHWNESTTTATVNLVDQQFDQLKLPVSPMTLECRLRVDQPTGCLVQNRYPLGLRWSRLWIDGIEIEQPTVVNLLPGLHAVRLVANDHTASPIFAPADAPYARALVDRDTLLQQRWNAARAKHARDGESAKFAFYVTPVPAERGCGPGIISKAVNEPATSSNGRLFPRYGRLQARAAIPTRHYQPPTTRSGLRQNWRTGRWSS